MLHLEGIYDFWEALISEAASILMILNDLWNNVPFV